MNDELKALIQRLKTEHPDLYAIAQVETTGGQNLAHKPVSYGLNKGTTAGGPWGMMPITAKEIVNRNKQYQESYPDINQFDMDRVTEILNVDPDTAYELARNEYERRLKHFGGDKQRTAYSWLNGVTGASKASAEDILASDYVQKFLKNLPAQQASFKVNKGMK